jgi:ABC-type glycerol-3-phosphate transport system substrate-binding protein
MCLRVLLALTAVVLAACGSGAAESDDDEARGASAAASPTPATAGALLEHAPIVCPDDDGTLLWPDDADLRYGPYAGGADHAEWLRSAAERFADESGVSLGVVSGNFYGAPVPGDLTERVTGDPPADVVSAFVGGSLTACAEQGLLVPLDDLWAERGWADALPAAVTDLATVEGQRYWAPTTMQPNPIFYRTDVFADLGLEPPTTWEDLLALCDSLRENGRAAFTSAGAWSPPAARYFTILNLRLNGAAFHAELLQGRHSWNDPRLVPVFDHWRQMIDGGCFVDDAMSNDFREAVEDLASGDAAMWNIGEWLYEFVDDDIAGTLDFFTFPELDPDVPPAEIAVVQGVAVTADAQDQQLARDLAARLSAPETLRAQFDALGRVAVDPRVDVPYDDVHARLQTSLDDAEQIVELLEFTAEPSYAASMLSMFVRFHRTPDELDDHLADIEAVRRRVFVEGG